jgi:C4-dicarboxylate-specific signal transduction histidine kinase
MFANQAAIAIERARLYENLHANLRKLESTNRQLEKTQKQIIRIERLSLVGEMAYRIAHELRNPLTIIGGFASLLLKTEHMSDTARERTSIIRRECSRVEKQLDTLLDFSRSYSQERKAVDLCSLIDDVIGMVQPKLVESNVTIESARAACPIVICAHKDQLLYGLYNMVAILGELSPDHAAWRLSVGADSSAKTITIEPGQSTVDGDEMIAAMGKFASGRVGSSDLKLSLANEAISYNGGQFGFIIDGSHPGISITFES